MSLEVRIRKKRNDALLDVSFETKESVLCLLGETGSGKTEVLRCIAGLDTPDEGRIVLNDRVLFDSLQKINLPCAERKVGYLGENTALFAGMSVEENVRLALMAGNGMRKESASNRTALSVMAASCLEEYGLDGLGGQSPESLSKSQRILAGFARMMAAKPELILLDEPFRELDGCQKAEILRKVRTKLAGKENLKALYAVADRDEAFAMGREILVLHNGRSQKARTKTDFFDNPETIAGAILSGCENISRIRRLDTYHAVSGDWGAIFCFKRRRRPLLTDRTWENEEDRSERAGDGNGSDAKEAVKRNGAEEVNRAGGAKQKPPLSDRDGEKKKENADTAQKNGGVSKGLAALLALDPVGLPKRKEKRGSRRGLHSAGRFERSGKEKDKKRQEEPELTPDKRWLKLPDDMTAVGIRAGDFLRDLPKEPEHLSDETGPGEEKKEEGGKKEEEKSTKNKAPVEDRNSEGEDKEKESREENEAPVRDKKEERKKPEEKAEEESERKGQRREREKESAAQNGKGPSGEELMEKPSYAAFTLHDTRIDEGFESWYVYFRPSLRSETEILWTIPKRDITREEILKTRKLYVPERKILWLME